MNTRQAALTEALLLFCVLLFLLFGGALALVARTPTDLAPPINLNTASPVELTKALGGATETAEWVVKHRPLSDVDQLARAKILPAAEVAQTASSLSVRTFADVVRRFWYCGLALCVSLVALHIVLRRTYPTADPLLLPPAALLSVLGILLLFGMKDPLRDRLAFVAQTEGVLLGMAAFAIVLIKKLWERPLHRYSYLYAIAACGLTLLLGIFGHGQGGVKLSLGLFQPVEVVKLLMVAFLAAYLADRGPSLAHLTPETRRADLYPLLTLYALPLSLFALLKDLGPVLLLFGAFLTLLYLATKRSVFVGVGVVVLVLAGWVGYLLKFGVFQTRVLMWLHPWDNTARGGDQLATGLWGMATGGPFGAGIGLGRTHFIPRGGSDLVFASVGEELGVFGTLAVLLCLLAITLRAFAISRRAATQYERFLAAGLGALLGIQTVVIAAGCLGLFPLTGITLPFVAFGKSSLVTTWLVVGQLAAISGRARATDETADSLFEKSLRGVVGVFALLFAVCALRTAAVQTILSRSYALSTARVPDADGELRAHQNPRLLAILNQIPRGRILDRNGVPLAETVGGIRRYPLGAAGVHVVGLLSPALGGPSGLEDALAVPLRGLSGRDEALALWQRKDWPGFVLPKGQDVRTTIDADLQTAAYKAIVKAAASVTDSRTKKPKVSGAAIVVDVDTGAILAEATAPSYEPNGLTPELRKKLIDGATTATLVNRATQGRYPPGSTFKIVTGAALLGIGQGDARFSGAASAGVRWKDSGKSYGRKVVNNEGEAFGSALSLHDAMVHSSNVYFANAAIRVGPDTFRETAVQLGLTHLPSRTVWGAELPDIGYGQGSLLASPLEMVSVVQTVANGGRRAQPYLYGAYTPAKPVLAPETARVLADALADVPRVGTARGIFASLPFSVAGKTGTAQTPSGDRKSHAWFVGFAPADDPKIAFAVLIENGGYGGKVAAPAARSIVQAWARK